jgi:hypothetical protein
MLIVALHISRGQLATMTIYPCAIFPGSPWLKRSLAYTPDVKGLPRSSAAVRRPSYAGTESGMGGTPTARHGREPLRTLEVLPLG